MKRTLREVKHARPGHRFQEYHDRTKRSHSKGSPLARAVRISLALIAFTLGAVLVVIPGPAIPFFFLAAALLATESRLVARFMDWSEVQLRKVFDWGHKHWRRLSLPVRIALVLLMTATSVTASVIMYRWLRG